MKQRALILTFMTLHLSGVMACAASSQTGALATVTYVGRDKDEGTLRYHFRVSNDGSKSLFYYSENPFRPHPHIQIRGLFGWKEADHWYCSEGSRFFPLKPGESFVFRTTRASWLLPWSAGISLTPNGREDPYGKSEAKLYWSPPVH